MAQSRRKKQTEVAAPVETRLWLIAIAVLAIVPFLNAIANEFVLDDIYVVVNNPLIRSPANLLHIFSTDYWSGTGAIGGANDPGLYRPLSVWSFSLDYKLWGLSPKGYHALNILLHAVTSVVVFQIAMQLLKKPIAAFVAAAVFAVHPIHVEAVSSVVGRSEVLAALFFSLALLVSMRDFSVNRAGAAAAFYLLALFSKEVAATFPIVLMLYDWQRRELKGRELAIRYGALAVAAVVYLGARAAALSQPSSMWVGFLGVTGIERMLTAIRVTAEYVGLFLFPRKLLAEYATGAVPLAHSIAEVRVLIALFAWAAMAALAIRFRKNRALVFGLAFFAITLLPISNILFPIGIGKAERILYLPSIGLCIALGCLAAVTQGRKWLVPAVAASIILALAIRTYVRNQDWKSPMTLAMATLRDEPTSPLMSDIAGVELAKRGAVNRALPLFQQAVRSEPNIAAYQTHLGTAYFSLGRLDDAQRHVREAIRLRPADSDPHNVLGAILVQRNQIDSALVEFRTALKLNPNDAAARSNLQKACASNGQSPALCTSP